jgi:sialate O-acetylesterase
VCTPETAKGFSAVGYYFGREILESQKIPVGLIGSNQGASRAHVSLSREALAANPALNKAHLQPVAAILDDPEAAKAAHDKWLKEGGEQYNHDQRQWNSDRYMALKKNEPFTRPRPTPPGPEPLYFTDQTSFPTVLFNARINPLVKFPIRGALWYQGESGDKIYDQLLTALITDWRTRWQLGDFPFLVVQLPNKSKQQKDPAEQPGGWAVMREMQMTVHQTVPNVGIIASIDLGSTEDPVENNNLHPVEKENIGRRLALAARHYAYGEKLTYSGPVLKSAAVQGAKIELTFAYAADGLKIGAPPETSLTPPPPQDELHGFAIAGPDKKFVAAKAIIESPDRVIVWSDAVPAPAFVRYGWQLSPVVNLYNSADLPAFPFRTDGD